MKKPPPSERYPYFPQAYGLGAWDATPEGELIRSKAVEAVEVANWEHLNRQRATAPGRALPGRPALVATREELDSGPTANLVPAALLLWALSV